MKIKRTLIAGSVAAAIFTIGFTACQFSIPKKVSVKTEADYSFRLGKFKLKDEDHAFSLQKYVNLDYIRNIIDESAKKEGDEEVLTKFKVYDYNPEGKSTVQQYIAEFNIGKNIELDVSKYFEGFNLDTIASGAAKEFNQVIDTPKFSAIPQQTLNMQTVVDNILNATDLVIPVSDSEIVIPELGMSSSITGLPTEINLGIGGVEFREMVIKKGVISIPVTESHSTEIFTEGFESTLSFKLVKKETGEEISRTEIQVDKYHPFTSIDFNIDGKSLYQKMLIIPTGTCSGGNFGRHKSYKIGLSKLSSDVKPRAIYGLTVDPANDMTKYVLEDRQITINVGDVFVEGKIGTGNLIIKGEIPNTWSGISVQSDINLTGALNCAESEWIKPEGEYAEGKNGYLINRILNLKDKIFAKDGESNELKILLQGYIKAVFNDADIVLYDEKNNPVNLDVKLKSECNIDSLEYMILNTESFASTLNLDLRSALPDQFAKFVKAVGIAQKTGFSLTYTDTLPEGNDVKLNVSSKFFGLKNKSVSIVAGVTDEVAELVCDDGIYITPTVTYPSKEDYKNKTNGIANESAMDVQASLGLPASTIPKYADPKYAEVHNVGLGQSYKLLGKVSPLIAWNEVILNSEMFGKELVYDSVDTGICLKRVMEAFDSIVADEYTIPRFNIKTLPLYLYCQSPDLKELIEKFHVKGTILFGNYDSTNVYGDADDRAHNNHIIPELDSGYQQTTIKLESVPLLNTEDIDLNATGNLVVKDINTLKSSFETMEEDEHNKDYKGKKYIDLKDLYNKDNEYTIGFYYKVGLDGSTEDGLTITYTDFKDLIDKGISTTLGVVGRLVIPLELNIAEPDGEGASEYVDMVKLFKKMAGSESDQPFDVFNRTEPWDISQISQFTDAVDNAYMKFVLNNKLLVSSAEGISIKVEMPEIAGFTWKQQNYNLSLQSDENQMIAVYPEDLEKIASTYPFEPKISVKIPSGTVHIPRDAYLDIDLLLGLKTNGIVDLTELINNSKNGENGGENNEGNM